ncbi:MULTISPECIES: hypothetical protein [Thermus]|uniref:Uncharacterized protein n=2 Tax=Thermus TaxID=270 RepID=H9ZV33_THETH|nr:MULTISPECIES: hypothetical protein [Thermus]AFH40193.1 hypothetical protein TtJL18_2365 [Thermus thermophilus JL-18]AFV77478.1 hypothetical protein Theos_2503 [Thermus oshimai JL-2]
MSKRGQMAALALAARRKDLEAFLVGGRLYLRGPRGLTQARVGKRGPLAALERAARRL